VYGLTRKVLVSGLFCFALVLSSVTQAGVNPFKKSKNYDFGSNVPWYENSGAAIKSGSVRDGADTNYYHLNIDKYRMLLRLGKNDPSGELVGTRMLDVLAITDVLVDGRQLPVFGWCLRNQQHISKKLKQNAVVANDACVNAGGGGDFVINLDEKTKALLRKSKKIEFIIEPYGRPVKLSYSMGGFAPIMAKINRPVAKPKKAVVAAPKPKPKPKPKAKPKPKPIKMCKASPPADYKSKVNSVAYPCANAEKKTAAERQVARGVNAEKNKAAAKLKAAQKQAANTKDPVIEDKKEAEWDSKQAALWISRCQRHWKKGVSPCYCTKYIERAPKGVKNTCNK